MYAALYRLLCMAYAQILRELVQKAIEDPNSDWDDTVITILDKLFDYKEE
ncbi:MAG: hypothetical protein J7J19_03600 [Thaumarchaeota archaeon]|nr:hypothetical protein [Nitrososphaerota archaeon]